METVFWKRFSALCAERNSTPTEEMRKAGFATGSVTYWKRGRIPNAKMLEKLTEYFGVEKDYFVAPEDNKNQPPDELEGLSPTAIQIAKLADRLPPEYLPAALALIESLERTIPNPGGGEQSQ